EVLDATPELLGRLAEWLERMEGRVLALDLPLVDASALIERLRSVDSAAIGSFLQ
ncbi:MAG: hypothetical protein GWM90_16990, partial [Gemmatimonadetes bacterium]|nr:hypothetical protein [Gemmatimonadota bacterium]NIQ56001.1 hypothetical protein [Gemmatimonadota bacterium]NIU76199.1 hypothetical protein [Gammaproteobacteria bacterium]NIX45728.1 hypothetical protein [Gemmatimonadota bacterium]